MDDRFRHPFTCVMAVTRTPLRFVYSFKWSKLTHSLRQPSGCHAKHMH